MIFTVEGKVSIEKGEKEQKIVIGLETKVQFTFTTIYITHTNRIRRVILKFVNEFFILKIPIYRNSLILQRKIRINRCSKISIYL